MMIMARSLVLRATPRHAFLLLAFNYSVLRCDFAFYGDGATRKALVEIVCITTPYRARSESLPSWSIEADPTRAVQ